jgi:molybdopterin-guanine dinucleotide biosynthesis protein A
MKEHLRESASDHVLFYPCDVPVHPVL